MDLASPESLNSEPANDHLRAIADFLPSPIFYCDTSLVYRYVNPAGAEWHGRTAGEIVGKKIADIMAPGQVALLHDRHREVLAGNTLQFEATRTFSDGSERRVHTEYAPHRNDDGTVIGFFVLLRDITEEYDAGVQAKNAETQLRMISDAVPALISFLDRNRRFVMVNNTAAKWFDRDPEDIVGCRIDELLGPGFAEQSEGFADRALRGERIDYQSDLTYPDGVSRAVSKTFIPNRRADGAIDGYVVLAYDVTEFKRVEDDLRLLATTDSLTGVLNRRRFLEVCNEEIVRARRYNRRLSVVMCDIDDFKAVNDTYGHDVGDRLIQLFASLAGKTVREGIDVVGRLGGEEFVLLLPETSISNARIVAERLRKVWENQVLETDEGDVRSTCSFGVAELSILHETERDILKQADKALYRAKESGRNQVCVDVSAAEASINLAVAT